MKVFLVIRRLFVKTRILKSVFILFSLVGINQLSVANSGGAEVFKEGVNYIAIKPPLVVNYGVGGNRVRYIKAEISMRVEDLKAAQEVSHHMPVIRDTLIMLFSSMTDEQVGSGQGKEDMRQEALKRVNEALETIEHPNAAVKADHASDAKPENSDAKKEHEEAKKEPEVAKKPDEKASNSVDDHTNSSKGNQEEHKGLVSDLLFDNLVVQR